MQEKVAEHAAAVRDDLVEESAEMAARSPDTIPRVVEGGLMADWPDAMSDDAKLLEVLLRSELPQPAWWIAEQAGVDLGYAVEALRRMAESAAASPEELRYPVLWRRDLSPLGDPGGRPSDLDVYESTEDSSREWRA